MLQSDDGTPETGTQTARQLSAQGQTKDPAFANIVERSVLLTGTERQTVSTARLAAPDGGRLQYVLLALILLLGAALRIHDLGAGGYWIDEIAMIEVAGGDVARIIADFRENWRPPVFVWLARGWMHAFGTAESATRSLPAIFGIAAIPMMFLVGRALFGPAIGLISAFLLALSTTQIQHAQSFRYYSLLVFMTLVSFFFYLRALRSGRGRDFAGWALASVLLFHTHHFGIFALAAQTLHSPMALWRHRGRWGLWFLAQAVIYAGPAVQLFVPLADSVIQGHPPPGPVWIRPVTWAQVPTTYKDFLFAHTHRNTIMVAGLAALAGSLAWGWTHGRFGWLGRSLRETVAVVPADGWRRDMLLVLLWVLLPVVCPFLLSILLKPMFVSRYTLSAAPAFYVLAACAIWRVRALFRPALALAAFTLMAASGLHKYYAEPSNEELREAAALVSSRGQPGEAILIARHDGRPIFAQEPRERLWAWYYHGDLPRCDRQEAMLDVDALETAVQRCLRDHDRVWFVLLKSAFPREFAELISTRMAPDRLRLVQRHHLHRVDLYLIDRPPSQPTRD